MNTDVAIFGGGAAGLWLVDALRRRGLSCVLFEHDALGAGQTIASQGILHGGVKYTLQGLLHPSVQAIRAMPDVWRACLAGECEPDLRSTVIRSDHCYLWRTGDVRGRVGMVGAKVGLRIRPTPVNSSDAPDALRDGVAEVYRIHEQVIDPQSLLRTLRTRNDSSLARVRDVEILPGEKARNPPPNGQPYMLRTNTGQTIRASNVVLCAGAGNEELCNRFMTPKTLMQRRPLHMVLVRGALPELYGHCVDGSKTRVTITSASDSDGQVVWQLGGQIAEGGVRMQPETLIAFARSELDAVIPSVNLQNVAWATYRIDRAEPKRPRLRRPDDAFVAVHGNVIVAWPTKLALVPRMVDLVLDALPETGTHDQVRFGDFFEQPEVASFPWHKQHQWRSDTSVRPQSD